MYKGGHDEVGVAGGGLRLKQEPILSSYFFQFVFNRVCSFKLVLHNDTIFKLILSYLLRKKKNANVHYRVGIMYLYHVLFVMIWVISVYCCAVCRWTRRNASGFFLSCYRPVVSCTTSGPITSGAVVARVGE